MEQARQAELFMAVMADVLRKKPLSLDVYEFSRGVGQMIADFNKRSKLSTPLTEVEVIRLYLEIMPALFKEHLENVQKRLKGIKPSDA